MRASWLIDQLVAQGVKHFCIAPGSRSAPLVLAIAHRTDVTTTVHFDERGLAFFALGLAKATRKPVAIVVTSGTAVCNLLPAIAEAYHAKVPLIALTADRPSDDRGIGANQTMEQRGVLAPFLCGEFELGSDVSEKTTRSIAAQVVFSCTGMSMGPVQLNCPFREPLYDPLTPPTMGRAVSVGLHAPKPIAEPFHTSGSRGIILAGAVPSGIEAIIDLAQRLQWPLFADILSNARCLPTVEEQIVHFEAALQSGKAPAPEIILHFGERMTSKLVTEWASKYPTIHISPSPSLQDPCRSITARYQTDIEHFCTTCSAGRDPSWITAWKELDCDPLDHPFGAIKSEPNATYFLGNSTVIRDADRFFFPEAPQAFFANRGLSGIDGTIATAAGIAEGLQSPVVAFIGDQAALHDLNSFALLKNRPIQLVIINNFSGAIFRRFPVYNTPHYDKYFGACHSYQFEAIVRMFDLPYAHTAESFVIHPTTVTEISVYCLPGTENKSATAKLAEISPSVSAILASKIEDIGNKNLRQ
ncbi:MAG: hypothetical protein RL235_364 [Chlamydiota bacterium]|jgi:2-succinyl-5-enolpyruvyl-6-hydroxy-3-cyclohexene-1-carboxylate synthase